MKSWRRRRRVLPGQRTDGRTESRSGSLRLRPRLRPGRDFLVHPVARDQLLEAVGQVAYALRCSLRLLRAGNELRGHLVDFPDRLGDLIHADRLLVGRRGDGLRGLRGPRMVSASWRSRPRSLGELDALRPRASPPGSPGPPGWFRAGSRTGSSAPGPWPAGLLGEVAHLRRDDREPLALLAGLRRLDGGVQREHVRLVGEVVDRRRDVAHQLRLLREREDVARDLLRPCRESRSCRRRAARPWSCPRRRPARWSRPARRLPVRAGPPARRRHAPLPR